MLIFLNMNNYMINKNKKNNKGLLFEVIAVTHIANNCVKVSELELVMRVQNFSPLIAGFNSK